MQQGAEAQRGADGDDNERPAVHLNGLGRPMGWLAGPYSFYILFRLIEADTHPPSKMVD